VHAAAPSSQGLSAAFHHLSSLGVPQTHADIQDIKARRMDKSVRPEEDFISRTAMNTIFSFTRQEVNHE